MYIIRIFFWLAILVVSLSVSCSKSTEPEKDIVKSSGQRSSHLTHTCTVDDGPHVTGKCYRFSFGTDPTNGLAPAGLEGYPLKESLVYAASVYALDNEDYHVTLAEVVNAGYWPYEILPSGDPESIVLSSYRCKRLFTEESIAQISTPEWRLEKRANILDEFYYEYYCYPMLVGSDSVLEFNPVLPDDLERISAFWVNPVEDAPFEYGEGKGMLREVPVSWLSVGAKSRLEEQYASMTVDVVNDRDLFPVQYRKNGKMISTVQYPEDFCCFWEIDGERIDCEDDEENPFGYDIECPCGDASGTSVVCHVSWQWYDGASYFKYRPLGLGLCTDYGGGTWSGVIRVPCNSSRTIYLNGHGPAYNYSVACPECPLGPAPEPGPDGDYCPEYVELMEDIVVDERCPLTDLECICP